MKMTFKDKKLIPMIQEEQFKCLKSQGEIFTAKYNRLRYILSKYGTKDSELAGFIDRCLEGAEAGNNINLAYYYQGIYDYGGVTTFKNWSCSHNHLARLSAGIGWLEAGLAYFAKWDGLNEVEQ